MTDGNLFALVCGVFFIFIAGVYIYIRETATQTALSRGHAQGHAQGGREVRVAGSPST